jgi:tetratricopeptide (TPR) repeat protein
MKRFIVTAALVLTPMLASAQPRAREYDRAVQQAAQAYEAHDGPGAVAALNRAYAIRPSARLMFNLGRAHELTEDFATAATYYQRFLAAHPDAQSAAVAQEALDVAMRRAAQQTDERRRREAAEEAARAQAAEAARLAEQQRVDEARRRAMTAVVTTRPRRVTTPVAIAWGVAGAGAVAGGIMGALALSAQSSFDADRGGNARDDAASRGSAMAIGADVALGTAAVAGVLGLVLFFTQSTTVEAAP